MINNLKKPCLRWNSPQETHIYEPLYLANGTFGGLLDLSGTDMNLWSSSIVAKPIEPTENEGVHYPVTALRTQVYYQNPYFKSQDLIVSRAAILSNNPIYTSDPSMPHKANVYNCQQSLDLASGCAKTKGTLYPGSRSSLEAGHAPERAIPFECEVVFLKGSPILSMRVKCEDLNTDIFLDPVPVLHERLVVDNSGNGIYTLGNELKTNISVEQIIVEETVTDHSICYRLEPNGEPAYTVTIRSEKAIVTELMGRPVFKSAKELSVQIEILPARFSETNEALGFSHQEIISEQSKRWSAFWAKSTLRLPESESLWNERYLTNLFYVAQSVGNSPTHPVGLSKPMLPYWYGSFHDTDTYFCRPLLEAGHFDLASLNLKYRHRILQTAFKMAEKEGTKGAYYPWQTDPNGMGEMRKVPMNQAIIACEAWHQILHQGDCKLKTLAKDIVTGIFENLLEYVDQKITPWDLKNELIETFSETIDARYPEEAILALRATAEAYLNLAGPESRFAKDAKKVLHDLKLSIDSTGAYQIVRNEDPAYLRCPSITLGAWPLRHLPSDERMHKSFQKELSRIVSVFAWMPHQLSALASRLKNTEGPTSAYALLKEADSFYKTWHAFDEWENRRTARAQTFITAAGGFCTAIHHMLIAETSPKRLSLFPGIPSHWEDCSFENLTTPLGWTFSATLKNGKIVNLSAAPTHEGADAVEVELAHKIDPQAIPANWCLVNETTHSKIFSISTIS